jgi:DMSO/TMAO reductase YedYZ molybdopterin-dependent catalytic subunit
MEHGFTRRVFFQTTGAAAAAGAADDPRLREAVARLSYLTPLERAYILDKGKAGVAKLPPERQRAIGQVPETWSLEMGPDGSSDARPVTLDWKGLMALAEKHAVRFPHVTVCTNGADPFHMTLWEGVPLREALWLTNPKANIRRVYYQSYHPEGRPPFQASLPLGHILETPPGTSPTILAYKMNGQVIPASHGGPVRVVVPGTYASKSIKWVRRLVLTNDYKANDSDAELNNDVESALKTRARFLNPPKEAPAGQPIALTGMAQVGISGLAKVQYRVEPQGDWRDAAILPPPAGVPGMTQWPMRYTIAHWAALVPGLAPGSYDLSCRTIDLNGIAQPMPRPLLRTGVTAIQRVALIVKA